MRIDSSKEREESRRGGHGDGVIRKYSSGGYIVFFFLFNFLRLKKKKVQSYLAAGKLNTKDHITLPHLPF